ncbi:MAG: hypothetical protein VXZ82_20740 [Planctomycetota bacterium]|nr:hypothetical protein [Planctomycetota bacterium]
MLPDDSDISERTPIVCHPKIAKVRLRDFSTTYSGDSPHGQYFFDNIGDILFVYESGEARVLDHDQSFFWAMSKLRN